MRSVFLQPVRLEPKLRRILSAGLALGLLGAVVARPVSMLEGYGQRRDEIEALGAEVGELRQRAGALDARQASDLPMSGATTDILAPDVEAAAAHLQATLRSLGMTEIRVDSVRVLPALPEGGATAVRASASLNAPGSRVFEVVNALEASTPPIVIDSLRIVSRADVSGARARGLPGSEIARSEMTLTLRVYARSGPASPGPSRPSGRRTSREERLP